jgi:hypothetical protein
LSDERTGRSEIATTVPSGLDDVLSFGLLFLMAVYKYASISL